MTGNLVIVKSITKYTFLFNRIRNFIRLRRFYGFNAVVAVSSNFHAISQQLTSYGINVGG